LPQNDLVGHLLRSKTGLYFAEGDYENMKKLILEVSKNGPHKINSLRKIRAIENSAFSLDYVVPSLIKFITNKK
jgi:hypothetical protein